MENNEDAIQSHSLKFSKNVNNVSAVPGEDTNQLYVEAPSESLNQKNAVCLPQYWIQNAKQSLNYVEFLGESSTNLPTMPTEDLLDSIPASSTHANGVFQIQGEMSNNYLGNAYVSKPSNPSNYINDWKVKPKQLLQGRTSWIAEPNGDNNAAPELNPRVKVSTSRVLSRSRANLTDRQRKLRIAERVNALQELLPHTPKGGQASVVDDIIDHIKYLQLQIKDLSQSKLGGDSTFEPFIFIEGYGHYISHQQMLKEPLEEMIGRLLEVNPLAAAQLLEIQGLFLMPIDLAQGLY